MVWFTRTFSGTSADLRVLQDAQCGCLLACPSLAGSRKEQYGSLYSCRKLNFNWHSLQALQILVGGIVIPTPHFGGLTGENRPLSKGVLEGGFLDYESGIRPDR